jgi:hypothetical protein
MGIGPISAVRPVSMIKPSPEDHDLTRVFEVEHMGPSADDEYTPASQKPSRGLEDEEELGQVPAGPDSPNDTDGPASIVSLFA